MTASVSLRQQPGKLQRVLQWQADFERNEQSVFIPFLTR